MTRKKPNHFPSSDRSHKEGITVTNDEEDFDTNDYRDEYLCNTRYNYSFSSNDKDNQSTSDDSNKFCHKYYKYFTEDEDKDDTKDEKDLHQIMNNQLMEMEE